VEGAAPCHPAVISSSAAVVRLQCSNNVATVRQLCGNSAAASAPRDGLRQPGRTPRYFMAF